MTSELKNRVEQAYHNERCISIIQSEEFYFQKAKEALDAFLAFNLSEDQSADLLENRKNYDLIKAKFEQDPAFIEFGTILFTLISYCDANAYRKQELNAYPDKRVLALAFVRMNNWIEQLLGLKFGISLPDGSINNAVRYLQDPIENFTMLSDNHRNLLAENLLKKPYNKVTITQNVIDFFAELELSVRNAKNYTHLISRICYLLPDEWKENLIGLLGADGTGWQVDIARAQSDQNYVTLWNHRRANGTEKTYKLLRARLEEYGSFKIFYSSENKVRYIAEIVDFVSNQAELDRAEWPSKYGDIHWYRRQFHEYQDDKKKASVIYLAKKFYAVEPIPASHFKFQAKYGYPSVGSQAPVVSFIDNEEFKNMQQMNNTIELLKYKKQIILQGPPGTGKTREAKSITNELLAFSGQQTLHKPQHIDKRLLLEKIKQGTTFKSVSNYSDYEVTKVNDTSFTVKTHKTGKEYPATFTNIIAYYEDQRYAKAGVIRLGNDSYEAALAKYIHNELEYTTIAETLENTSRLKILQFHPSYTYEDFVRGITTETVDQQLSYRAVDRTLVDMANSAALDPTRNYVLILDEINRANLSAVLGELIYALEYRGQEVDSMYEVNGSTKISIPENLYIIGTMNTADRSVGHIDYAIRRRFAFIDVPPQALQEDDKIWFNESAYNAVRQLFQDKNVSPEFEAKDVQLGHSYFLVPKEKAPDAATRDKLFRMKLDYEVKPILREYVRDGVLIGEVNSLGVSMYIEKL
ncbi:AAA family ATPase [Sphingobacterium bambusae]|uniref:AAA family ATPase n=1 Tax=Sphingobacterium bambusae TaxID=662858 RepID=A0ABW6BN95_9SPHI|nr:AAA family ATPase [Sphingobacterium bambusae]WPL47896.1 AAA family ATPase [Sphingobacterium bambusae]